MLDAHAVQVIGRRLHPICRLCQMGSVSKCGNVDGEIRQRN
jgi:hypothetical protein